RAIVELWPKRLAEIGRIDLAERRNRLLDRLARRWRERPPDGFTVAAGITTSAPAVAALLHRIARMPDSMVVLPALSLATVKAAEFADAAAEAQGIALALRRALETPGNTAALVTPDRMLARRVSALLRRWGIEADDSAGQPLSESPVGTLLLAIAAAAAEELA